MQLNSRRSFSILVLILLLSILVAACDAPPPIVVTATPEQPTDLPADWPTQEVATWTPLPETATPDYTWDQSCIADIAERLSSGNLIWPLNENACLTGECLPYDYDRPICFPEMYELVVIPDPIENGGRGTLPTIYRVSDGVFIEVYNFDGHIIVEIHGLELSRNVCYSVNVLMDVNFEGSSAIGIQENYSLTGRIYGTDGARLELGVVSFLDWSSPSNAVMSGERNRWFNFTPIKDRTAYLELDFFINHAVAVAGSVKYKAIYVTQNPVAGNCVGMGF